MCLNPTDSPIALRAFCRFFRQTCGDQTTRDVTRQQEAVSAVLSLHVPLDGHSGDDGCCRRQVWRFARRLPAGVRRASLLGLAARGHCWSSSQCLWWLSSSPILSCSWAAHSPSVVGRSQPTAPATVRPRWAVVNQGTLVTSLWDPRWQLSHRRPAGRVISYICNIPRSRSTEKPAEIWHLSHLAELRTGADPGGSHGSWPLPP